MILYKDKPFALQMKNVMLLDEKNYDGCLYVSKETYDQAILLWGRLDGDPSRVESLLTTSKMSWQENDDNIDLIHDLEISMPEPLNMIAPFLMFAFESGMMIESGDYVTAYGVLHMFSQMIDFNAMTLVPSEVRLAVKLPVSILKNFESSWDDICSTLAEKVAMSYQAPAPMVQPMVAPVVQSNPAPAFAPTPASVPTPVPTPTPTQDISKGSITRPDGKVVNLADIDAMLAQMDAEEAEREQKKEKEKAETKTIAKPATTSASAPVVKSEPTNHDASKENAILDEYDV